MKVNNNLINLKSLDFTNKLIFHTISNEFVNTQT